jgi:hypothetical protein
MEFDDNTTTINPVWGLGASITGYGGRKISSSRLAQRILW